ncbi:hypothetical protein LCGC14_0471760 [marine sediment metagenome]|uniref:Uncharacterized protein n=1 Tax=marine sediment metagenome TaxID=412755 RepID=A0A0F9SHB7_9ZZZZ
MIELINKQKIKADNYITGFLLLFYLLYALIFRLEWIMSVIVYPLIALFFYGILKIMNGAKKRNKGNIGNLNKILLGITSILSSIAFLSYLVSQPTVNTQIIINLGSFPLMIVGIAAVVKGILTNVYLRKYRRLNIIIGITTIILCSIAFASPLLFLGDVFIFHMASLSLIVLVNVISRAAMYLSEFGLSVLRLSNFKLFFYIISDYLLFVDQDGNIILNKIE